MKKKIIWSGWEYF